MPAKKKRRKKRKLKKGFKIAIITVSVLAVIAIALTAVIMFVPNINILMIDSIGVSGDTVYTDRQIIEASELNAGISVLKVNLHKAEKKIMEKLPYIGTADVSYSFDGTVTISVELAEASYQIKQFGRYFVFNEDFKALDGSGSRDLSVCDIVGLNLNSIEIGKTAEIQKDTAYETFRTVYEAAKKRGIGFDIIDVSNEAAIVAVFDDRLVVEMGSVANIDEKMSMLVAVLAEVSGEDEGRILLDYWSSDNRKASLISESVKKIVEKY